MEVRHNTTALERALEVIAMRAEAPFLVASAAASDKIRRGEAIRRLASGAAIAIAAIGIGLGFYLSKKEPLATTKQEVSAQKQIPVDTSNLPKPQHPAASSQFSNHWKFSRPQSSSHWKPRWPRLSLQRRCL